MYLTNNQQWIAQELSAQKNKSILISMNKRGDQITIVDGEEIISEPKAVDAYLLKQLQSLDYAPIVARCDRLIKCIDDEDNVNALRLIQYRKCPDITAQYCIDKFLGVHPARVRLELLREQATSDLPNAVKALYEMDKALDAAPDHNNDPDWIINQLNASISRHQLVDEAINGNLLNVAKWLKVLDNEHPKLFSEFDKVRLHSYLEPLQAIHLTTLKNRLVNPEFDDPHGSVLEANRHISPDQTDPSFSMLDARRSKTDDQSDPNFSLLNASRGKASDPSVPHGALLDANRQHQQSPADLPEFSLLNAHASAPRASDSNVQAVPSSNSHAQTSAGAAADMSLERIWAEIGKAYVNEGNVQRQQDRRTMDKYDQGATYTSNL